MASKNAIGNEVAGQRGEHGQFENAGVFDEDGFEVVDEVAERERNLRATVEMEIRARIDTDHYETRRRGLTLEQEERIEAREWELRQTRVRFDRQQESDREARTRRVAVRGSVERRRAFCKRAASVDLWADPDVVDPREQLSRDELGAVNREAARLAGKLPGWSQAAISRRVAERVVDGCELMSAVIGVFEEFRTDPGRVVPIEALGEVQSHEVNISGTITQLWEPRSRAIQQVGLIEDESGRTKFTVWEKSNVPMMAEGDQVVLRNVARNWYQGRCSVALTGWSSISFSEGERWWSK
ncbi:DNA-binding protein [Haloprofundus halophilus]|uniref:DNA-binding protein n=1 Tax=Haloprofundus halophilus TaxID=2283527 RepID=UPI000E43C935|nr:DNA-binding protein [Haloprofundus halophilus]